MRRTRRTGYALVELLLAMSALAIVFGVCAALIHSLFRLDRIGRAHYAEVTARTRLARQFRADAHATVSEPASEREAARGRLTLELPEGRIVEYRATPGRVSRIESRGETVLRSEAFRFPARSAARFQTTRERHGTFVSVVLPGNAAPAGARPSREIRIEAQWGKDRRSARLEEAAR